MRVGLHMCKSLGKSGGVLKLRLKLDIAKSTTKRHFYSS